MPIRSRYRLISLAVAAVVLVGTIAAPASADSINDKKAEAKRVAAKIEQLHNAAEALAEQYNGATDELGTVTKDVAAATAQLAAQDQRIAGLKSKLSTFAVRTYVMGDSVGSALTPLSDGTAGGAAQRQTYASLFLGTNVDAADQLAASREDIARLRATLAAKQKRQADLTKQVADRSAAMLKAVDAAVAYEGRVQGELATLVQQERVRQQQEEARQAAATLAAAQRAAAARATAARAPAGGASAPRSDPSSPPSFRGPPAGTNVPPPSPGAAGAVAAARSQLGVPYRFAAATPGVAFDCSGLTMWAWGRAGVSLPHFAASQYHMLPHVPIDQAQPGDLVFFYPDLHHVAIYIGGGLMITAPQTGDVVKIAPAFRSNLVGIGRPG